MIRKRLFVNSFSVGFLPLFKRDFDEVSTSSKYAESIFRQDPNETGRDRLFMMYSTDEFGQISPELVSVIQAGMLGLFSGACIGGFIHSKNAYINFMETNQATAFSSHFEAKKKLQDKVTINFAKGAFKWGWRLGLFSSSYVLITTSVSVYRGKSGIVEYLAAGGLTGAVYKCNLGLRGIVVGGILGTILGGVAGALSLGILKLTGTSMEEVRFWQHQWKTTREGAMRESFKKMDEQEEDPLTLERDKILGKKLTLDLIPEENQSKEMKS